VLGGGCATGGRRKEGRAVKKNALVRSKRGAGETDGLEEVRMDSSSDPLGAALKRGGVSRRAERGNQYPVRLPCEGEVGGKRGKEKKTT